MSIFSREKYVLIDTEEKEIVWEGKELVSRESVVQDIEKENLPDKLYRLEIWKSGRKVRNAWVMKKPRTPKTAEEQAAEAKEKAEAYIQQKAIDIKKEVEDYRAFVVKVKGLYGIEAGDGVDKIKVPTGEDGKLSIIGAANQAIAESTYLGIRETKPTEVAASFKSVMDSGTTILAGIAQMFANRITETNNRKKKPAEKKEEPEKKKENPKDVETHKEDLGEGKTKTTFGTMETPEPAYQYQKTDLTSTGSDTPKPYDLYEEYKAAMFGSVEEAEEPEKE